MISLQRNLFRKSSQLISCQRLTFASHAIIPAPIPTLFNLRSFSATPTDIEPPARKRLDIAIVGLPNAGKSQLLNSLVGTKVAAVSRKRHTTRSGILAACTLDNTQLVFVDTPGFMHHASTAKEGVRQLAAHASSEMDEVDHVLLVMDGAKKLEADVKRTIVMLIFMALRSRGRREGGKPIEPIISEKQRSKFAVVINKVDLVSPKEKLLGIAGEVGSMSESCIRVLLQQKRSPSKVKLGDLVNHVLENHMDEQGFDGVHDDDVELFAALTPEFHFTSAIDQEDEGVDDVLGMLLDRATVTNEEWIVDADEEGNTNSVMTPPEIVEEILREKIYRCLHREVPHNVSQQNKMFRYSTVKSDDGEDKRILHIGQDLVVRTKSHQKLVIGTGGKTLQRIKETALKDLEQVFDCVVDLELNVKFTKSTQEVPLEAESLGALGRLV